MTFAILWSQVRCRPVPISSVVAAARHGSGHAGLAFVAIRFRHDHLSAASRWRECSRLRLHAAANWRRRWTSLQRRCHTSTSAPHGHGPLQTGHTAIAGARWCDAACRIIRHRLLSRPRARAMTTETISRTGPGGIVVAILCCSGWGAQLVWHCNVLSTGEWRGQAPATDSRPRRACAAARTRAFPRRPARGCSRWRARTAAGEAACGLPDPAPPHPCPA